MDQPTLTDRDFGDECPDGDAVVDTLPKASPALEAKADNVIRFFQWPGAVAFAQQTRVDQNAH